MAKFPTEVGRSVTVDAPIERAYAFLWDVAGSSSCIPGIDTCTAVGDDTYRFVYREVSTGPVSMVVRYTSHYRGNGKDEISFESIGAEGDNTDVTGTIRLVALPEIAPDGRDKGDRAVGRLAPSGKATRITLQQKLAPDTPVPRLLQGVIRGFVEGQAAKEIESYLERVKQALEA